MTEEVAICADGIGKHFAQNRSQLRTLNHALFGGTTKGWLDALSNVSFEAMPGDTIGFIGRNGAGKSTLLQILCGTMTPSTGTITTQGRIGALLELGAGFHPDFTGRENAKLSSLAHGVPGHKLEEKMILIEAFAGLGKFFDRKVQQYSSGMQARLAFAVATHVDVDILVVDEVLGVGDAGFQAKCLNQITAMVKDGVTLLFVSHDPAAITSFCRRAIWLEAGRVIRDGPAREVVADYVASMYQRPVSGSGTGVDNDTVATLKGRFDPFWSKNAPISISNFQPKSARYGFGGAKIVDCFFSNSESKRASTLLSGEVATLHVLAHASRPVQSPIAGYVLRNDRGQNIMGDNTFLTYVDNPVSIGSGENFESTLSFRLPFLPAGRYTLAPSIIEGTQQSHVHLDWIEDALFLDIGGSPVATGHVGLEMVNITVKER